MLFRLLLFWIRMDGPGHGSTAPQVLTPCSWVLNHFQYVSSSYLQFFTHFEYIISSSYVPCYLLHHQHWIQKPLFIFRLASYICFGSNFDSMCSPHEPSSLLLSFCPIGYRAYSIKHYAISNTISLETMFNYHPFLKKKQEEQGVLLLFNTQTNII